MAAQHDAHGESPERQLLERLKAHDSDAWAELYNGHYTSIWRYVVGRTGSREIADDVAAQVFLEALQSIGRFRLEGKPIVAWLYTIARNHAAKSVRARRREIQGPLPEVPGEGIEAALVDSLALAQALGQLTKDQRDIVALRHYAGCSTTEIATVLGKSERAVYAAETRAMASLRRLLQSENLTPEAVEIRPAPGIEGVEGR